ncbi:type VI secretion system protein TssA [Moritella sp. 5]|uniref:type VI secretion system protein TssA n=1 Tax=Moritella sp. 5 TaxID=2746231 RepID=UPI001BA6C50D|nr:type VI secretion system protein TssA [Moritella sp. 5]QUM80158.1 type VI secretion system protein TssA [Moritella sp. 5]
MKLPEIVALLEPISNSSPAGEDAKYEFCYEVMESEIKKFGSLFGETVDWKVVDATSTEVLVSHSKDFKPLCYLIRSMVERKQFVGLRDGLELLLNAITIFGKELYPRRKRGRDGVLDWLLNQLDIVLPKIDVNAVDQSIIFECEALAKSVSSALFSIFEDIDVNFNRLANTLTPLLLVPVVPEPVSTAQMTVENEAKSANASDNRSHENKSNTAVTPLVIAKELDVDFSTAGTLKASLGTLSHYLLSNQIGFGLAYRINRYIAWCDIDELPSSDDAKTTLLSLAISADKCAEYQSLATENPTVELIKQLEKTLINSPFWLTGHFIQYKALKALNYLDAAEAIKSEVQALSKKFKGIAALRFSNNIPFADIETTAWLDANDKPLHTSGTSLVFDTEIDYVDIENIGSFIFDISKDLDSDSSGRGRFMNYLQIIKVYQLAGLHHLCLPYIEKLWPIRCDMNLVNWEPVLCTQLDYLVNLTLSNIYENSDDIPDKYQEWKS